MAATSASSAWAVGSAGSGKTLILRWNGTAWKQVPSPSPGRQQSLRRGRHLRQQRLGGRRYQHRQPQDPDPALERHGLEAGAQPEPGPGIADFLNGVAATSAGNAWAVGDISCGCGPGAQPDPAVERHSLEAGAQPDPCGGATLFGVAAASARNAWAVG